MKLNDPTLLKNDAFIDGQWVAASDGAVLEVKNPVNQEVVGHTASCGGAETIKAIEAAERAFATWSKITAKEKAVYLRRWYDLIIENADDLAQILTAEQGKPLAEAKGEIIYGSNYIEWYAEEAKRIYGDTIPQPSNDKRIVCIKQPVGVVACITPWNFPSAMLTRKLAPALAAGCTVVCKPANETPLSAYALCELANRAGIPNGVINVLNGRTAEIGHEMTESPVVKKLTFTGSTAVGKKLQADCAKTMKRTSMELGGNAPFIVFDDANLDDAVQGAIASKYRNAGQTCVCANRMLVQEGIYDEFVEKLTAAVNEIQVGDGTTAGVTMGPLIHDRAAADVRTMIDDAVSRGATEIVGQSDMADGGDSCFIKPTILTNVTTDMRVFQEEIFGPVAPLFKFSTEEEAIQMANDTEYGLASYMYARDIGRIWRVGEALEYGMVAINEGILSNEAAPFGGIKESGHGREGSKYGFDDYLEIKYFCMGGIDK